jgi:hypothetical protein
MTGRFQRIRWWVVALTVLMTGFALTATASAANASVAPAAAVAKSPAGYAGCPGGYACMYTDAGFNSHPPVIEHKWSKYACYKIYNEYGWRAIVNSQTGGATIRGYTDGNCKSQAWSFRPSSTQGYRVLIDPINSISLNA